MGVPKPRASRQVLAHLALMSPSQRSARDMSRLARVFFPQLLNAGPSSAPSASTSAARSLYTAAQTAGSPTVPLFFDSSFAEASKDTAGNDGSSAQSGSQLPLLGPVLHHPPPGPRFKPIGPRSALPNSTNSDASFSSPLAQSSPSLRLIGYPTSSNAFPPFFGSVVGFKNPRRGSFTFRNGAYGIAKNRHDAAGMRKLQGKSRQLETAVDVVTRKQKPAERVAQMSLSVQVGEDAYFLRSDSFGVADGVGGWTGRPGANSALFSRNLMHHCSLELASYEDVDAPQFMSYHDVDPIEVLQRAYERCLQEARENGIVGSSTALLAVLRSNELRIANIGDCCCSIIRGNEYIFRTEEQQHSFNYPVQIGTNTSTSPEYEAQGFTVKVQKNDIVILSSDGLGDNLFDEDILEEVLRFTGDACHTHTPTAVDCSSSSCSSSPSATSSTPLNLTAFSPQLVSEALCARAKAVSESHHTMTSPFAQRAMQEGIYCSGGKQDDISVLVAVVGDQEEVSPFQRFGDLVHL